MSENKTTCPICFTKMQRINHSLTCPECGYRYCDHSYDNRDLYSTDHTHAPQYTTATHYTSATQQRAPQNAQNMQNVQQRPPMNANQMPRETQKTGNVVKRIIIIYLLIVAFIIFRIFFRLLIL